MKMNQENMKRFEDMVRDWANDNNLTVEVEHDFGARRTVIAFKMLETRARKDVVVYWDNKKSLSQAGAIIFAHITREFNLDQYNTYLGLNAKDIKDVIFNDPATIVLWTDGTKTVVKRQDDDVYSKEIGLAMCIAKKAFGNKGNFNDIFKKWIPEPEEETAYISSDIKISAGIDGKSAVDTINAVNEYLDDIFKSVRERFKKGNL